MIKSATLYTDNIKALRRFYGNVLELDMTETTDEQFTVKIGESLLTFKHSEQPAFYHFAINIPGNQFSMMKYWIQERVTLNREEGQDEVYFQFFDADAMYFEDPAGNIVELIGRRKRDLFGDLSKESFLNISEMSITTPHVAEVGDELQDLGIPLRNGTKVNPDELNFLGRGDTFLVLVPPSRRWYFSKKISETYPLELTWNDTRIQLDEEGKLSLA
ncbi:glyoxalase [Sporosarcina sp. ACRSL]|uniref:glyoxalase n=1 Tax=Sporosarcina sp. ACRSL TaxID=2918215 RepID=UPI001EF4A435|nr:glyoxalase [Sporosarcina sp. ACRSL]MCG7345597.1 glyoxalase [Sporosarcina sp. ACRSL]